jgi:DNA polymerase-2
VLVLDFTSLYPSIIRTFRIDPLGLACRGEDPVPGFLGAGFAREGAILPAIITELWQQRDAAKREANRALTQAIKTIQPRAAGH